MCSYITYEIHDKNHGEFHYKIHDNKYDEHHGKHYDKFMITLTINTMITNNTCDKTSMINIVISMYDMAFEKYGGQNIGNTDVSIGIKVG